MITQYAVIEEGVCINIIDINLPEHQDFADEIGAVILPEKFGIGDFFDGVNWTKKPQEELPDIDVISPEQNQDKILTLAAAVAELYEMVVR